MSVRCIVMSKVFEVDSRCGKTKTKVGEVPLFLPLRRSFTLSEEIQCVSTRVAERWRTRRSVHVIFLRGTCGP